MTGLGMLHEATDRRHGGRISNSGPILRARAVVRVAQINLHC
jgi:hypothetical protein